MIFMRSYLFCIWVVEFLNRYGNDALLPEMGPMPSRCVINVITVVVIDNYTIINKSLIIIIMSF